MSLLSIGNTRQLFIDDFLIEESKNVRLVINPPIKMGPVLKADREWEGHRVGAYGSVIEDEGIYKMFYDCIDNNGNIFHCYAYSKDGIKWIKPKLGLVEYKGSRDNNILPLAPCGTVFIDPHDIPERKYKYVTYGHGRRGYGKQYGVYVWYSKDGLNWKRNDKLALPLNPDTQNQAFWDDRIGKFVAYLRAWCPKRCVARVEIDNILDPWPFKPRSDKIYDSQTPEKWPTPTTELPIVFRYDDKDPDNLDHYNPCVIKYPFAEDVYFMFPSAYLHFPEPPIGKYRNDGLLDIQIATSRDGIHWNRLTRDSYIRLGKEGELDSKAIYMLVGMIRKGDEIWMYYGGFDYSHGAYSFDMKYKGTIFRVVQRLDGFTSVDADYSGGEVITKPLKPKGNKLVVNADTSATGELRVEILDEDYNPIKNYSLDDSDRMHFNSCNFMVTWHKNPKINGIEDKIIRLRFVFRNTKLYAFQFID